MERVRIQLPEKTLYTHHFTITSEDINAADHMGNERILVHANAVRIAFYKHFNLIEGDYENGHGVIVANHTVNYKSEGFLKDEIACEVGINQLTECSFDLVFHFIKNNEKTLALLRTGCIYYDYNERKIRHLPENFVHTFTA